MNGEFFRQTDYRDLSDTFGPACQEADRILLSAGLAQVTRHPDRRNSQSPSKSRLVTINASSVKPRNIDFLWAGRLARGKHTCFAGEGGLGKSQLARRCDGHAHDWGPMALRRGVARLFAA